jgi:hypothetical protein
VLKSQNPESVAIEKDTSYGIGVEEQHIVAVAPSMVVEEKAY